MTREDKRQRYDGRPRQPAPPGKRCSRCGRKRALVFFRENVRANGLVNYASDCNDCHKAYNRSMREKAAAEAGKICPTRSEIAAAARARAEAEREGAEQRSGVRDEARLLRLQHLLHAKTLVCKGCGEEKPRHDFHPSNIEKGTVVCKTCSKQRDHDRFQRLKTDRPEAYRKRLSNPRRIMRNRVGALIREALFRRGAGKPVGVFRYLPYTVEELSRHIERTFAAGMTWSNMSRWHIDHIRPVDSFEFTSVEDESFLKCWALTNLRAAWAHDNLSKGARRLFLL